MAYLKAEAPVFRDDEPTEVRIERIGQYQLQLRRELEYVLSHLGSSNMNSAGFAIAVTDSTGAPSGSVGKTGNGVGITAEEASVIAEPYTVTLQAGGASISLSVSGIVLMFGSDGLRIVEGEVSKTSDGGETWSEV